MNQYRRCLILAVLLCTGALLAACQASAVQPTPSSPPESTVPVPVDAAVTYLDDFESSATGWKAGVPPNYSDSGALSVEITTKNATHGSQALKLIFDPNLQPKAIFYLERPLNLADPRYLSLDLNVPAGSAGWAAISLSTGPSWTWHESLPVPLETGTNTLSFDLQAENYTTAASNWQPVAGIQGLEQVQRLALIVYTCGAAFDGLEAVPGACSDTNAQAAGIVYLDAVRLGEQALGRQPEAFNLPTTAPVEPRAATFLELTQLSPPAGVYERLELAVETDGVYANPFDPGEVDLRVRFQGPEGQEAVIPAFWYQEYHQEGMAVTGEPEWRARFTPTIAGKWTATAILSDLRSPELAFEVTPAEADAHGFIRIQDNRFVHDDGQVFYPLGINMGWGSGDQVSVYESWLKKLAASGGNLIRVWMASWSFGIEWNDTGLSDYTNRLYRAWQLDQVFAMAEARGIAIELVLLNHGAFSERVNPEWDGNPYNVENGGMCAAPECFATDPQAREYFKLRLRYIAARWGYSTALFAWEWWNEADWTPIDDPEMAAWIQEMTPGLLAHDPNNHLVSTSYAQSARPAINNLPEIDFSQVHLYSSVNPALQLPDLFLERSQAVPGKPVLFAEFGADAGIEDANSPDQQGLHLHNGLWAATFSGFASPAMYWWWDTYVDPLDLWPVLGRMAKFLESEDPGRMQPGKFRLSSRNVPVLALVAKEPVAGETAAMAWIHDRKNTTDALQQARLLLSWQEGGVPQDWVYQPEPIQGLELTVLGLPDGTYTARWYAPGEGQWLEEAKFNIADGEATLAVPEFTGDVALKIIR